MESGERWVERATKAHAFSWIRIVYYVLVLVAVAVIFVLVVLVVLVGRW